MRGSPYTRDEIRAIHKIDHECGPITYCKPAGLEQMFFEMTGKRRRTAPIYFAAWRIRNGFYDYLLK